MRRLAAVTLRTDGRRGKATHAHVDAAAEVGVFVHKVAVAVLLRRPRARPDAPRRLHGQATDGQHIDTRAESC